MEKIRRSVIALPVVAAMAGGCVSTEADSYLDSGDTDSPKIGAYLAVINGVVTPRYMAGVMHSDGILAGAPGSEYLEVNDDLSEGEFSNDVSERVAALLESGVAGGVRADYEAEVDGLTAYVAKTVYRGVADGRSAEAMLMCDFEDVNGLTITANAFYYEDGSDHTEVSAYDDVIYNYMYGSFDNWENAPSLDTNLEDVESATDWLGKVDYMGALQECVVLSAQNVDYWPR